MVAAAVRYLLANWKMHTTVSEALASFHNIQEGLRRRLRQGRRFPLPIVCPPFLSLVPLRAVMDEQLVRLGAQTCHWEDEGPYTGEISPAMLKGIVDYVMVGHSERRAAGETEEQIARKVAAVTDAGLVPILFVGEDEPGPDAARQSEQQLERGLARTDLRSRPILFVYEPRWAIGAEKPAEPHYVRDVVEDLKARLHQMGASDPQVIYGGTVSDEYVEQFAALEVLDGVGATRASLDPDRFFAMVDRLGKWVPAS